MNIDSQHRSATLMKCQEHLARIIAAHMGRESFAAKALEELDERRLHGETVTVFPFRGKWIVGSAGYR